ncbi:MAG TPA: transporter substrate-binding domain-containing protein [Malonomonas sp.]
MKKLFLLFLILLMVPGACFAQPRLLVMTEELPPFNFSRDGAVVGISADFVRLVFQEANYPLAADDIKMLPWARAYQIIKEQPNTVLFSMARTAEREQLFQWVGPLTQITIGLLAEKERRIRVESAADLANYRIGTVRDGAPEQLLVQAGANIEQLDRVPTPEMNIRKLQSGRIDLFPFNVQTAQYLMLENGFDPNDFETVYILRQPMLYIALHRDVEPQLVTHLQQALDRLKRPGTNGKSPYDTIVESYLGQR